MDSSQLSVAVGIGATGTSFRHCTLISLVKSAVITGFTSSLTTTIWVMVSEVLPQASVAHHLRVRVYLFTAVLSEVVWLYCTTTFWSALSVAVMSATAGMSLVQLILTLDTLPTSTGAVTSLMWMVCITESLLPEASVNVQVRMIVESQAEPEPSSE